MNIIYYGIGLNFKGGIERMKIFDGFRKKHELKLLVIERERTRASREKLNLIKRYEKSMIKQAENLRKEFDKELSEKIDKKNTEIHNLKKLMFNIKSSAEDVQSLSAEMEIELRTANIVMGKSQNRFSNIEQRAFREIQKIDKKIEKYIDLE